MSVDFQRGRGVRGGTWRLSRVSGDMLPLVVCPGCGAEFALRGYQVEPGGHVQPRVECATKECRFVDYVRLVDWQMEAPAP
jgi:hypothetical protein